MFYSSPKKAKPRTLRDQFLDRLDKNLIKTRFDLFKKGKRVKK
jgi:hypothetical protein